MVHVLDEANPVFADLRPEIVAAERVDRESAPERAVVADRFADEFEHLSGEPGAVLERTTVLVRAPVEVRHQELLGDRDRLRDVDQDKVEPGLPCALGGGDVVALKLADVPLVHLVARAHQEPWAGNLRDAARRQPRLVPRVVRAAEVQLDPGERAVIVRPIAHQAQVLDVVGVPDPRLDRGQVVALRMDRAVLGVDHRPAARGLHPTELRLGSGVVAAEARAVGRLVEAVAHHLRPDAHRLEQQVVFGIPSHRVGSSKVALEESRNSASVPIIRQFSG